MSESTEGRSPDTEAEAPTHFIVKVRNRGKDAYALCTCVLLVEHGNLVGISSNDLDRFIENNAIRAAALLSGARMTDGMSGRFLEGMSGKSLSFSVDGNGNTINLNDLPGAG